MSSHRML